MSDKATRRSGRRRGWLCFLPLISSAGADVQAAESGSVAARFDVQFDDSRLRTIEASPTQAADMTGAAVGAQAGLASAAATPGYTPGAGAAGLVLGLGIAKSIQNASVRRQANAPFEPLRTVYAGHWQDLDLRQTLLEEWDKLAAAQLVRCSHDGKITCPGCAGCKACAACKARITLRPSILLLSRARVLSITIEAKLRDGRIAHTNTVNFNSEPLSVTALDDINDYWRRDDLRAIGEQWHQAMVTLIPLLQSELQRHQHSLQGATEPIRFVNAAGLFYDRGTILSRDDHRVTYRSLDDSITIAYMDRLLDTDQYYEWLTQKAAGTGQPAARETPPTAASPSL